MRKIAHTYHVVKESPWPITTAISLLSLAIGTIMWIHRKELGAELGVLALISVIISIWKWLKEVIIEGSYTGKHTKEVQKGLNIGFSLFIISEVIIFAVIMFAYIYNSIIPGIEIGSTWPPKGIEAIEYKGVPLLNTVILFMSSITITGAQQAIQGGERKKALWLNIITIVLCVIFTILQYFEYLYASFTLTDSVYGSGFYVLTGLHGIHVIIGTIYIIISLIRLINYHFTESHLLGSINGSIYNHFLDYVWIILFGTLYFWGS